MRGGSDQAFLDGGLLDVVAARGRPFRHGHAQAPTPLPLDDNASEVQGERRAETRSSYAEPQPSLAVASQMQWQRYNNSKGRCPSLADSKER